MGKNDTVSKSPPYVEAAGEGKWRLRLWVQPKAKKTAVVGVYQDCLKIKLQAPPVDNKANQAVCRFVAARLGLRPADVDLGSGQASRKKTIVIASRDEPDWTLLTD
ncbi:DUF167 domain-containing protein [Desulfohalobium retbaense]|jgi:hypothetical protein|uniref:UPF0235 protein Dret_1664 n=1 Tax=Desulfohalobium retbaense (strain ATCC 49708 / DSM 5692 / JCM 16813 / HR100) TaxID=485915 RepID=C8X3F1_DESRD|nr:DUF167 domain-containing protein [Desulfohalobium retbaense]ACV68948.1 protein of unknown function DUF167 [Desulfohalobium retbaense DSM 5692]